MALHSTKMIIVKKSICIDSGEWLDQSHDSVDKIYGNYQLEVIKY